MPSHFAAKYRPFCGKSCCILRQNAVRFAAKWKIMEYRMVLAQPFFINFSVNSLRYCMENRKFAPQNYKQIKTS